MTKGRLRVMLGAAPGVGKTFAMLEEGRRLLDTGRCWVKISGPYESSRTGPPDYEDVAVLARALITHYPERCLWASNWPHPNIKPGPSNTDLLRWFLDLTGSDSVAQMILVRNPAEVYGYQTLSLRA